MHKRILLIGGNFLPEPTGIGKYNGEMIQWFARNGYQCTVIATAPYYPHWKVQKPYTNKWFQKEVIKTEGAPIEVYRCPHYVPNQPSGAKRLFSELSFSASSLIALLRILGKKRFNYVITVAPPFQLGFHALLYKKLKGAKFLYHIQDLQIEAARDLKMVRSKRLISFLFQIEKHLLRQSDSISSISAGMIKKISSKTGRAIIFFPNWVDTVSFHPLANREYLKEQFGFRSNDKVILYSGAIGEKQGLEIIINAAHALAKRQELQFIICGSGPYKEKLQQLVLNSRLGNIHFMPLQPHDVFNAFLNMADLHLVIQKEGAGDLVMPSKLTTILAVGGLALVTAAAGTSLFEVVQEHQIGIVTPPEQEQAFVSAILQAVDNDMTSVRENARRYAEHTLNIDNVLSRFATHMETL